ncbi:MAG: dihydroneopterin aldolase [Candidatus Zophobacter franzmannii]|nr:dihydroneopterin aldolase [Candidatus Zophobacter franzmannii]
MKIHLEELVFYGFHGVYDEERKLGQRFIVSVTINTDCSLDRRIHHLDDTLDYTKVYSLVKEVMETHQYHLLENCVNKILDEMFERFELIQTAEVSIKKPSVPIQGPLKYVEVSMARSR